MQGRLLGIVGNESARGESGNRSDPRCPNQTSFPTAEEFYHALGGYAVALYAGAATVTLLSLLMYLRLLYRHVKEVPPTRLCSTLWINSIYPVVAIAATFSIALPRSSRYIALFYKLYLGLAMRYFVKLTLAWYGGMNGMMENFSHDTKINLRTWPCCLCCACPNKTHLTRKKIEFFKFAVYQMPYVQTVMIFLIVVLSESNYLDIGEMTPKSPYPYLTLIMLASFFFGLWGTLMFFNLTFKHNLLTQNRYRFKTGIFKAAIFLINTQGIILEVLGTYELIPCVRPYVSSLALAYTIKNLLSLLEGFVLGIINFVMYEQYHDHL